MRDLARKIWPLKRPQWLKRPLRQLKRPQWLSHPPQLKGPQWLKRPQWLQLPANAARANGETPAKAARSLTPPSSQLIVLIALGFLVAEGVVVGSLPGALDSIKASEAIKAPLAKAQHEAVSLLAANITASLAQDTSDLLRAKTALDQAIAAIENAGFEVGFCVTDPSGQPIAAQNDNVTFYGASSIKGPFVIAAFADDAPQEDRPLIQEAIVESDNEAYRALKVSTGPEVLSQELEELGVSGWSRNNSFLFMTPKQLAGLWAKNYNKLMGDNEDATWLRTLFSEPIHSPISELAGATTASKGGWIDETGYAATVDAGIITRGNTTYIMAVMTNKGADFDALAQVVNALDAYVMALGALGDGAQ